MNKTLCDIGEFGLIDEIAKHAPINRYVTTGIGDDAAVLQFGKEQVVVTKDMLVENVDFRFSDARPYDVGHKAIAINMSDLAAMGAKPVAALIGLAVPRLASLAHIREFDRGANKLLTRYQAALCGGDLSRASHWMISVTMLGRLAGKKPILRSGAKAGDLICVTGQLGGSMLGKHLHFEPRLKESELIAPYASSMIDISDGLIQDLEHILKASHIAATLELSGVPISTDARRLAIKSKKSALEHALSDGEDFELLFTISPKHWSDFQRSFKMNTKTRLTRIGRMSKGKPEVILTEHGIILGKAHIKKGFSHF